MTVADPMGPARNDHLDTAYRRTLYCICAADTEIVLRVDHYDPLAETRILSLCPFRHWSILTPFNPYSRLMTPAENGKRLEELVDLLNRRHQRWLPTLNRDPGGRWPDEPGTFLCDPPPQLTESLGRHFGQFAFLRGQIGQPPHLTWLKKPEKNQ